MQPLVPDSFAVPAMLKTDDFCLRMLSIHDVVKDYDAVMTSIAHLRQHFAYAKQHSVFGDEWPSADLSLMEDLADLGWHEAEFKKRSSFTYTVVTPDDSECLGCVYILPPEQTGADAEVYLWVRKSAYDDGLDPVLFEGVQQWLKDWPFKNVAFPGRIGST